MRHILKAALLSLVGLSVGSIAGGLLGIGCGLIWTTLFQPQASGAYSGMLIFLTFMPMGVVSGAISGAIGFGTVAWYHRLAVAHLIERKNNS